MLNLVTLFVETFEAGVDVPLAFYERDPVDIAIEWGSGEQPPIPVIMPAHDKRPGGDWETGMHLRNRISMLC